LQKAWEDPVVRDRTFTTPLALAHIRQPAGDMGEPDSKHRRGSRAGWQQRTGGEQSGQQSGASSSKGKKGDKGKGKSKGDKGKGKGKGLSNCAKTTPDGKPICYSFNNRAQTCKAQGCKYEHVCGVCFAPNRPMYDCSHGGK